MAGAGFRVGAALLAALALWEIGTILAVASGGPADEDWRRAADWVRASFREGDLVVFAPAWTDPVGRQWLGDLIPLADAGRMDAARYPHIFEVSLRGSRSPEAGGAEEEARDFGALRARRLGRVSPVVTWDLRARSRLCAIDFQPRYGLVLRLRRAGATARAAFPDAQLGSELHVYAGLARRDHGWRPGAVARLTVLVDGRPVSTALVGPESMWAPLPVARTEPGLHEVALVATAAEGTGHVDLDLCVAAEGRRPR